MEQILNLLALAIVVLTFYKPKYGILLLLVSYILLPEIPFGLGGISLKKNHLLMLALMVLFFRFLFKDKCKLDMSPYRFCLVYFFLSLLCIPLKFETAYSIQIYYIIYDIAIILLFPIAIWNVVDDETSLTLYRKAVLICIAVACIYGLFLTTTNGLNPLIILFSSFGGGGLDEDQWTRYFTDEGRLFGRISSVFFHPMSYASFLGFSAIYVGYVRKKISRLLFFFLTSIIFVNFITCGVRSVLGAFFAALFVYILMKRNIGLTVRITVFFILVVLILSAIPPVYDYVSSIFDESGSDVEGSSLEMRLDQLAGAFEEVKNNALLGKGYGWSRDYIIQNVNHPILLGFESIIFVVLCNNGIIGILLYGLFVYLYFHYIKTNVPESDVPLFISMLVFYLAYETITGEFAFQHFMLFYTLVLMEVRNNELLCNSEESLMAASEIDSKE